MAGKLNGVMPAERLAHRVEVDARAGSIGVFTLEHVGGAHAHLDHFDAALDVALGIGDGLAMLAGQDVSEFVDILGDEIEELHQHARAALRIGGSPGRLRRLGIGDSGGEFGHGGERDLAAHGAVHGLDHIGEPP